MYGTQTSPHKEETRGAFGWDHIASFDSHEQQLPNSFCQVLNTLYSRDQSYNARVTRGDGMTDMGREPAYTWRNRVRELQERKDIHWFERAELISFHGWLINVQQNTKSRLRRQPWRGSR